MAALSLSGVLFSLLFIEQHIVCAVRYPLFYDLSTLICCWRPNCTFSTGIYSIWHLILIFIGLLGSTRPTLQSYYCRIKILSFKSCSKICKAFFRCKPKFQIRIHATKLEINYSWVGGLTS
jgi:hypothetical protein